MELDRKFYRRIYRAVAIEATFRAVIDWHVIKVDGAYLNKYDDDSVKEIVFKFYQYVISEKNIYDTADIRDLIFEFNQTNCGEISLAKDFTDYSVYAVLNGIEHEVNKLVNFGESIIVAYKVR